MFKTRVRKILRDVWSRKGRTFLVSIAIFFGVAGTMTLTSITGIIVGQLNEDINIDRLGMLDTAYGTSPGYNTIISDETNLDMMRTLEQYPNVTEVQPYSLNIINYRTENERRFDDGTIISIAQLEPAPDRSSPEAFEASLQTATLNDSLDDLRLEPMRNYGDGTLTMRSCTEIKGSGEPYTGELVVEARFAESQEVAIGDDLIVRILEARAQSLQVNGRNLTFAGDTLCSVAYQGTNLSGTLTRVGGEGIAGGTWTLTDANLIFVNGDEPGAFIQSGIDVGDGITLPFRLVEGDVLQLSSGAIVTPYLETIDLTNQQVTVGAITVPEERWRVVGTAFHPYAGQPKQTIYANYRENLYISGILGYNGLQVRFNNYNQIEKTNKQQEFNAEITKSSGGAYVSFFYIAEDPEENSLITGAQTIGSVLTILAVLALLVSGFLVINVISSIVVEQKRLIGVMKSMGASRADNFFIYSGMAFVYGLIGVIPATFVSIPLGYFLADLIAADVNTLLDGFRVFVPAIIIGILLGLFIPVFASIIPVWFGTRVQILEAMTDLGIDAKYGSGPIARFINILPVPITIRQGLSNVSIKKARLLFTTITLTLAVGTFMGIYAIFYSISDGINEYLTVFQVEYAMGATNTAQTAEMEAALREMADEQDIRYIEAGGQLIITFKEKDIPPAAGGPPGIFIYAYDSRSTNPSFRVEVLPGDGTLINEENYRDSIIITKVLAEKLDGAKVGDVYTVQGGGSEAPFRIVGLSEFPVDQVWMDWRALSSFMNLCTQAPQADNYQTTMTIDTLTREDGALEPVVTYGLSAQTLGFFGQMLQAQGETVADPLNVILSPALATRLGVQTGDSINISGDVETRPYVVTVLSLETLNSLQAMAAQQGDTGFLAESETPETVLLMLVNFNELVVLQGAAECSEDDLIPIWFGLTTTFYGDDWEGQKDAEKVDDAMNAVKEELLKRGIPSQAFNFVEIVNMITNFIFIFQAIFSVVAGLIAVVGALGLLTTLSMSVFERQKEIGVMRSIGAGSWTIALQFLTEGLVVGIIAWLVGLPISYGIAEVLILALNFGDTFTISYPPIAAVLGLVGMIVITALASIGPSLSAANKTVSNILRYQ